MKGESRTEFVKVPEAIEIKALEAMRSVVKPHLLSGTSKILFEKLYPETAPITKYDVEAKNQHPTSKYSDEEKKVAALAYNELGFVSDNPNKRKSQERSRFDLPLFRVSYLPDESTFINRLNDLTTLRDLRDVTMVTPIAEKTRGRMPKKMDREIHSKILGAAVTRDIIRMAIKTPDLFLRLVERDVHYFRSKNPLINPDVLKENNNLHKLLKRVNEHNTANEVEFKEMRKQGKMITPEIRAKKHIEKLPTRTMRALATGIEYAKYVTLFAYLHDSQTPALADIIMKAKARYPGQEKIKFSEDAALRERIGKLLEAKAEGIGDIFDFFKLNRDFFITQVMSMSEENDHTLGGMLIKNKRNEGYQEKGGSSQLAGHPAFDRDQVAGTGANMEDRANLHLPGGFRHSYKTDPDWSKPIGSFEERLRVLAYAMARNLSLKQLTGEIKAELGKHNIRNEAMQKAILHNITITAEEFEYGPNFILRELPYGEIVPVALNPGALKRLLHSFATLTYFHYQSDQRSAYETLCQDILTTIHAYQKQFWHLYPSKNPEMTHILSTFMKRSDSGGMSQMRDEYPLLNHIIENFLPKATRVTEEELPFVLDEIQEGNGHRQNGEKKKFVLVSRAKFFPVNQKDGTLVEDELDENRTPTPYLEIINKKKKVDNIGKVIGREDNSESLPNRLNLAADRVSDTKLYYVIKIDEDDVKKIKEILTNTKGVYKNLTTRALRYWMMALRLPNNIFYNPLRLQFLLPDEDPMAIFNHNLHKFSATGKEQETSVDLNTLLLNEAQGMELYPELYAQ